MTIKEAQAAVDHWIKTYGVRYFNEPESWLVPMGSNPSRRATSIVIWAMKWRMCYGY